MTTLVSQASLHSPSVTHPDDDGTRLPRSAYLEVCTLRDVIEEELQQVLGLLLLVADDAPCESGVDVEGLFAGHWMLSNDRMLFSSISSLFVVMMGEAYLRLYRLPPHRTASLLRVLCLIHGRVYCT